MPQAEGGPPGDIVYEPLAGDTIAKALFDTRTIARIVRYAPVVVNFNGWRTAVEADFSDVKIGELISIYCLSKPKE